MMLDRVDSKVMEKRLFLVEARSRKFWIDVVKGKIGLLRTRYARRNAQVQARTARGRSDFSGVSKAPKMKNWRV
jgi:hypothetical protein